jgi:hypothetical protein
MPQRSNSDRLIELVTEPLKWSLHSPEQIFSSSLETSEEDVDKTTLETSEEDVDKTTLKRGPHVPRCSLL